MNIQSMLSPQAEHNLRQLGWEEWLEETQHALPRILSNHHLTPERSLYGGKMGYCFLAKDAQGQQVVVKAMPNPSLERQALALTAMDGWRAPRLVGQDLGGGILWTAFLPGQQGPEEYSAMEVVDALAGWNNPAPAGLPGIGERFAYWVDFIYQAEVDGEILRAVEQADLLLSQLPDQDRLLHGDLSWHNLLRHQDGSLYLLDPAGMRGPVEWDIACMALYHAPKPEAQKTQELLGRYCSLLGADRELAGKYCAIRSLFSMARSVRRKELGKVEQSLEDFQRWAA